MPYGSVLVVDDMETNIYVARGLLAPYGLAVDAAESGPAAIEKITQGKVYDIVFMDHMMPGMDGIEATQAIRGLGYTRPVVALTANAMLGQAEMFRERGFDDFIAKPIDLRQLNAVLNKFVRDAHPPEVVEAARLQQKGSNGYAADITPRASANPHLTKTFIRDASKSLAALEALCAKQDAYSDEDIQRYIVNVHGMKGALANIGEAELSALAFKLEQAGRARDTAVMVSYTPVFLSALREVIERITPPEDGEGGVATDEDRAYLREKLLALKAACVAYDKKIARDALTELGQRTWFRPTKERLDIIAEHLLHSKFKSIMSAVDEILEG
jgi:CheY-like chemotaxis protein